MIDTNTNTQYGIGCVELVHYLIPSQLRDKFADFKAGKPVDADSIDVMTVLRTQPYPEYMASKAMVELVKGNINDAVQLTRQAVHFCHFKGESNYRSNTLMQADYADAVCAVQSLVGKQTQLLAEIDRRLVNEE